MSAYHKKILRIPHHGQNPTKRYLTDAQIIEVFKGEVWIQEKIDGKQSITDLNDNGFAESVKTALIIEDMTGKHTVHKHVMHYDKLPATKKIVLDRVVITELKDGGHEFVVEPPIINALTYGKFKMVNPTISQIHLLLNALSHSPSHFGSKFIEGLVIKNYRKQLFCKWINSEFEDMIIEPLPHPDKQPEDPYSKRIGSKGRGMMNPYDDTDYFRDRVMRPRGGKKT